MLLLQFCTGLPLHLQPIPHTEQMPFYLGNQSWFLAFSLAGPGPSLPGWVHETTEHCTIQVKVATSLQHA